MQRSRNKHMHHAVQDDDSCQRFFTNSFTKLSRG